MLSPECSQLLLGPPLISAEALGELHDLLTNLLTFERAKTPQPDRQPLMPVLRRCVQLLRAQAQER